MLDHLHSPDEPAPGNEAAAVARGRQLRFRRQAAVGAVVAVALLGGVTAVVLPASRDSDEETLFAEPIVTASDLPPSASPSPAMTPSSPAPRPTPTPTALPTSATSAPAQPTASASGTPRPLSSTAAPGVPSSSPSATPSRWLQSPSPSPWERPPMPTNDEPDGKPGWRTIKDGVLLYCSPVERPPWHYNAPGPDLELTLTTPPRGTRAGTPILLTYTIKNTSTKPQTLRIAKPFEPDPAYVVAPGQATAETTGGGGGMDINPTIAPGGTYSDRVSLVTTMCGDTSSDPEVPVPPGTYRATVSVYSAMSYPGGDRDLEVGRNNPLWWVTSAPFALS